MCVYCTVMLRFNGDLTVRLLKQEEHDTLPDYVRKQLAFLREKLAR